MSLLQTFLVLKLFLCVKKKNEKSLRNEVIMKKIFQFVMLIGCLWASQSLQVDATIHTEIPATETPSTEVSATATPTANPQTTGIPITEIPATAAPTTTTTEINDADKIPQNGYFIYDDGTQLQYYYNGIKQYNTYAAVKKSNGHYKVVKPTKKNSTIFYFDENGIGAKHQKKEFVKIKYKKKKKTYFSNRGKIEKNKIVGNKKQGYFYVDNTGVKVKDKTIKLAVKFVRKHTKSKWSQSKKLKACYTYFWKNYTYKRSYDKPRASKMSSYAKNMLTKKHGNCHRYAATFAYIARVLGYDVRVSYGSIPCLSGGVTPHGWTEIKINNHWYLFDANMQRNYPNINSYQRTEKTYAYPHKVSKKFKMKIKNGKVIWK